MKCYITWVLFFLSLHLWQQVHRLFDLHDRMVESVVFFFFFYNLWFQLACSLPCLRMLKASEDYYQRLPLAPLKCFWSEIFLDRSQPASKSSWIIDPPALPPSFKVSFLLFCLLQLTASFSHSTVPLGWFFFFFQPRLTCDGGRQIQLKWRGEGGSTQQCPLRWLNVFHVLW